VSAVSTTPSLHISGEVERLVLGHTGRMDHPG